MGRRGKEGLGEVRGLKRLKGLGRRGEKGTVGVDV